MLGLFLYFNDLTNNFISGSLTLSEIGYIAGEIVWNFKNANDVTK